MYEGPIELMYSDTFHDVAESIDTELEEKIMVAIMQVGINVNKEELVKALQYDRDQYAKGWNDAIHRNDAFRSMFRLGFEYARKHPECKYFDDVDWNQVKEVW
jgi:hypothetical protein